MEEDQASPGLSQQSLVPGLQYLQSVPCGFKMHTGHFLCESQVCVVSM